MLGTDAALAQTKTKRLIHQNETFGDNFTIWVLNSSARML